MPTPAVAGSAPRWGLVADDLTGACDAGVQFAQRGFSVLVHLDAEIRPAEAHDLAVLTTESRQDAPAAAAAKVERACRRLAEAGARLVFKKLDSTLRGNVGAEIIAARESGGFAAAVMTPAFPAMGRTVSGGMLHAGAAAPPADIPALLGDQGVRRVVCLDAGVLNAGERHVAAMLESEARLGGSVIVADAATQEDLATVARAASRVAHRVLVAGSAGLAMEVAGVMRGQREEHLSPGPAAARERKPVLFVLGSPNPVTERQLACLVERRPVTVIRPGPAAGARIGAAARRGRSPVIRVGWAEEDARSLPGLIRDIAPDSLAGLVLSGGDTASLVCRVAGAAAIRLVREIVVGIPWGRIAGGLFDGLPVATKAGGFGDERALVRVMDFVAGLRRTM